MFECINCCRFFRSRRHFRTWHLDWCPRILLLSIDRAACGKRVDAIEVGGRRESLEESVGGATLMEKVALVVKLAALERRRANDEGKRCRSKQEKWGSRAGKSQNDGKLVSWPVTVESRGEKEREER